jgi:hypothetical protein
LSLHAGSDAYPGFRRSRLCSHSGFNLLAITFKELLAQTFLKKVLATYLVVC